jgi:hypothetical protein
MIKSVVFFLIVANSAFAVDSDVEVVPQDNKVPVVENSSEFNRMEKSWTFGAQVFGAGPSYATNRGISAGYFLNRNMVVFLEFMTGDYSSSSSLSSGSLYSSSQVDVDGKSIGAHFKQYVGNSFYYRIGLDVRTFDYEFSDTSGGSAQFKATSVGATFNIGNQWQWKNFHLGCDWIGFTVPLSKSYKDELLVTGGSFYTAEDLEEDKDVLVEKTTVNLLRFYLGASF